VLTLHRRIALLERAAPGGEIAGIDDQGYPDRARLAFRGTDAVKYAYLDSVAAAGLPLRMYPADTLEQARVFYKSPGRVERTLALRERGWILAPHFHWGFMTRVSGVRPLDSRRLKFRRAKPVCLSVGVRPLNRVRLKGSDPRYGATALITLA
jgi:hypothetical protein